MASRRRRGQRGGWKFGSKLFSLEKKYGGKYGVPLAKMAISEIEKRQKDGVFKGMHRQRGHRSKKQNEGFIMPLAKLLLS